MKTKKRKHHSINTIYSQSATNPTTLDVHMHLLLKIILMLTKNKKRIKLKTVTRFPFIIIVNLHSRLRKSVAHHTLIFSSI